MSGEQPWRGTVRKKLAAIIVALSLLPIVTFSATKEKGTIEFKVVSFKTKVHAAQGSIFSYTSIIFAQVGGMNVVLACAEKGDLCPLMDNGKTYTAEKDGDNVFIPMSFPDDKRPMRVRYKQAGTW